MIKMQADHGWILPVLEDLASFCRTNGLRTSEESILLALGAIQNEITILDEEKRPAKYLRAELRGT